MPDLITLRTAADLTLEALEEILDLGLGKLAVLIVEHDTHVVGFAGIPHRWRPRKKGYRFAGCSGRRQTPPP